MPYEAEKILTSRGRPSSVSTVMFSITLRYTWQLLNETVHIDNEKQVSRSAKIYVEETKPFNILRHLYLRKD